jgi:hypothetical protein
VNCSHSALRQAVYASKSAVPSLLTMLAVMVAVCAVGFQADSTASTQVAGSGVSSFHPTDYTYGVGYDLVGSDGGVYSYGSAPFDGSVYSYGNGSSQHWFGGNIVGASSNAAGTGYYLASNNAVVCGFGSVNVYVLATNTVWSPGNYCWVQANNVSNIVGVVANPNGSGYWLVGSDGGVFSYAGAQFYGSEGGQHLNAPIVAMVPTPDGNGYWLIGSDGGIFSFGDAQFYGSEGGQHLNAPIVGMARTANGGGYWLVGSDGGIFSFGNAPFDGSPGGTGLPKPVVGMAATADGGGYWLTASDGAVFAYGDAPHDGAVVAGSSLGGPIVGVAEVSPGPTLSASSTSVASSGGQLTLAAKVPGASSYSYSVSPSIPGWAPGTGSQATVVIPADTTHNGVTYTFGVIGSYGGAQSAQATVSVTQQGAPFVAAFSDSSNGNGLSAWMYGASGTNGWDLFHVNGAVVTAASSPAVSEAHGGYPYIYYADATHGGALAVTNYTPAPTNAWTTPYDVTPAGFSVAPNSSPSIEEYGGEPYVWFANGSDPIGNGYALALAWYNNGWNAANLSISGFNVARNSSPEVDQAASVPNVYFANAASPVGTTGYQLADEYWAGTNWAAMGLTTSGYSVANNSSPTVDDHGGIPYVYFANGASAVGTTGYQLAVVLDTGSPWGAANLTGSGYSVANNSSPVAQEHAGEPYIYFSNGSSPVGTTGNQLAVEWYYSGWASMDLTGGGYSVANGSSPSLEGGGNPDAYFANGASPVGATGDQLALEWFGSNWASLNFAAGAVATPSSPSAV